MTATQSPKTVGLKAIQLRRGPRPVVTTKSVTTPNLTLSINQLIERSNFGTLTQKPLNGVYHNANHPDLQGWENMDKIQKLQAVKKITDEAVTQVKTYNAAVQKQQQEQEANKIAEIKQIAIAEHEAAKAAKL